MAKRGWIALVVTLVISGPGAGEQEKPERLTFEVASIHQTKPGATRGMIKALPGGTEYTAQNVPVKLIISLMYRIPMRQISGGPDWMASEGYDIEAKADRGYSIDDLHVMFQNLLLDRFNLKFHKESKEGNVYALAIDKAGLKMKANASEQTFDIPVIPNQDGTVSGTRVPMPYFCWWLGNILQRDERPVIDRTGLAGYYDWKLSFAPDLPPDFPKDTLPPGVLDRPSIFDALRQQLGLTLTAQRGPVEYYVIDHIDRPTDN